MPEDFLNMFYNNKILSKYYHKYWQEYGECYGYMADRDLIAMYYMMSV